MRWSYQREEILFESIEINFNTGKFSQVQGVMTRTKRLFKLKSDYVGRHFALILITLPYQANFGSKSE